MWNDARIHQRGGGIAVFMAEIGADELPPCPAEMAGVELQHGGHFVATRHEHFPRLPVTGLEIAHHKRKFVSHRLLVESEHGIDDAPASAGGSAGRLPTEVEGAHHHP